MLEMHNRARNKKSNFNIASLKSNYLSNLSSSTNPTGHRNLCNTCENENLKNEDINTEKSLNKNIGTKDAHLKLLKKYLKQNSYIGNVEAINRLQQETGLILTIATVRKYLKKLRQELGLEYTNLDLTTAKNRLLKDRSKFNGSHLEYLKNYLKDDNFIGPTEAKNRLQEDTGLETGYSTVQKAMIKLRKKMDLDCSILDKSTVKNRRVNDRSKMKHSHLEHLKKYLEENIFIGPTEAKDRLYQETGLEVKMQTIFKHLKSLRKIIAPDYSKPQSCIIVNKHPGPQSKFKDSHLEYLKKYLEEYSFIGPTKAKNRLQEDTGLEIGYSTVQKAMVKLRKEMGLERDKLDPYMANVRQFNDRVKLKDYHLLCLKKYLVENNIIGLTEAKNRLEQETGLKVHISTIRRAMDSLLKEMSLDRSNIGLSAIKYRHSGCPPKLKNSHFEYLKNYLEENIFITPTEAKDRLQNDTGLKISYSTAQRVMLNLRKEMKLKRFKLEYLSN